MGAGPGLWQSLGPFLVWSFAEPTVFLDQLHDRLYANVPMGLADVCLVRMTETLAEPVILTTDQDFRVYRRRSRQVAPV